MDKNTLEKLAEQHADNVEGNVYPRENHIEDFKEGFCSAFRVIENLLPTDWYPNLPLEARIAELVRGYEIEKGKFQLAIINKENV